jgi:hypothetical protein
MARCLHLLHMLITAIINVFTKWAGLGWFKFILFHWHFNFNKNSWGVTHCRSNRFDGIPQNCKNAFQQPFNVSSWKWEKFIVLIDCYFLKNCKFHQFSNPAYYVSPPLWWGDILFLSCPSVRHTVCQRNSSETTEQNFMKLGR